MPSDRHGERTVHFSIPDPENFSERRAWILLIVTAVADIVTTGVGLQIGISEGNAFVAYLLHTFGFVTLPVLKILATALMMAMQPYMAQYRVFGPMCLSIPWGAAVIINLYVLVPEFL